MPEVSTPEKYNAILYLSIINYFIFIETTEKMLYKDLVTNLLVMRPGKGRQRSFGSVAHFGVFLTIIKAILPLALRSNYPIFHIYRFNQYHVLPKTSLPFSKYVFEFNTSSFLRHSSKSGNDDMRVRVPHPPPDFHFEGGRNVNSGYFGANKVIFMFFENRRREK